MISGCRTKRKSSTDEKCNQKTAFGSARGGPEPREQWWKSRPVRVLNEPSMKRLMFTSCAGSSDLALNVYEHCIRTND
jgi:hypothetical protein